MFKRLKRVSRSHGGKDRNSINDETSNTVRSRSTSTKMLLTPNSGNGHNTDNINDTHNNNNTASSSHSYSHILPDVAADQSTQASPRLFDYLLIFQRGQQLPVSSDSPQTYQSLTQVKFQPELLDRYPAKDYPGQKLPPVESLMPFIFPEDYPAIYLKRGPASIPYSSTKDSMFDENIPTSLNLERRNSSSVKIHTLSDMVCPKVHWLVFTDAGGTSKQYVCVLRFWEQLTAIQVLNLHKSCHLDSEILGDVEPIIFSPKALVLVSRYPFYNTMKDVLKTMYAVSVSEAPVPIERFISNLMNEVPAPPRGSLQVQFTLGDQYFTVSRPPPNSYQPLLDSNPSDIFKYLSLENSIIIFRCLLAEQRVVFCSSQATLLVFSAEVFSSFLFPFYWQGVYIPLLSRTLLELIHAPVPFIAGLHTSLLQGVKMPADVVFVDIDRDKIHLPTTLTIPNLPDRDLEKLLDQLEMIASNLYIPPESRSYNEDYVMGKTRNFTSPEHIPTDRFVMSAGITIQTTPSRLSAEPLNIKTGPSKKNKSLSFDLLTNSPTIEKRSDNASECFLRFFVKILAKYRVFLTTQTGASGSADPNDIPANPFDSEKFIQDSPDSSKNLLKLLVTTQMFEQFVMRRWSPYGKRSLHDPWDVQYFDEAIIAKQNRSKMQVKQPTPFLDDSFYRIQSVFSCPLPNTQGLSDSTFIHQPFTKLNPDLFGRIRQVETLVKIAEDALEQKTQFLSSKRQAIIDIEAALAIGKKELASSSWDYLNQAALTSQAYFSSFIALKKYAKIRQTSLFFIDRVWTSSSCLSEHEWFTDVLSSSKVIQSWMKAALGRYRAAFLQKLEASLDVQAFFTALLSRQKFSMLSKVQCPTLQGSLVAASFRLRFRKVSHIGRNFLLPNVKTVLHNRTYGRFRRSLITLQSHARGKSTRKTQKQTLSLEFDKLKKNLISLWNNAFVDNTRISVYYRSSFWNTFCIKESYLNLSVCRDELANFKFRKNLKSLMVGSQAEENVFYQKLKTCPEEFKNSLYEEMGIPVRSKKRKRTLARVIWADDLHKPGNFDHANHSSLVLLRLYDHMVLDEVLLRKSDRVREDLYSTVSVLLRNYQDNSSGHKSFHLIIPSAK